MDGRRQIVVKGVGVVGDGEEVQIVHLIGGVVEGLLAGARAVGEVRVAVELPKVEVIEFVHAPREGQNGDRAFDVALLRAHDHHGAVVFQQRLGQHRLVSRIVDVPVLALIERILDGRALRRAGEFDLRACRHCAAVRLCLDGRHLRLREVVIGLDGVVFGMRAVRPHLDQRRESVQYRRVGRIVDLYRPAVIQRVVDRRVVRGAVEDQLLPGRDAAGQVASDPVGYSRVDHRAAGQLHRVDADGGDLADRSDRLTGRVDRRGLAGAGGVEADIERFGIFAALRHVQLNGDVAAADVHRDEAADHVALTGDVVGRAAVAVARVGVAVMAVAEVHEFLAVRGIAGGEAAGSRVGNAQTEGQPQRGVLRRRDLHLQIVVRRDQNLNFVAVLIHLGVRRAVAVFIHRRFARAHAGAFAAEVVVRGVGRGGGEARCDVHAADVNGHHRLPVHAVVCGDQIAVDLQVAGIVRVAAPGGDDAAIVFDISKIGHACRSVVVGKEHILRVIRLRPAPVSGILRLGRIALVSGAGQAEDRDVVDFVAAAVFDHVALDGFVVCNDHADHEISALRGVGKIDDIVFQGAGDRELCELHPRLAEVGGIAQRQILRTGRGRADPHLEGHGRAAGGVGDHLPVGVGRPARLAERLGNVGAIGARNVRERSPAGRRGGGQNRSVFKFPRRDRLADHVGVDKALVDVLLCRLVVGRIGRTDGIRRVRTRHGACQIDHVDLAVAAGGDRRGRRVSRLDALVACHDEAEHAVCRLRRVGDGEGIVFQRGGQADLLARLRPGRAVVRRILHGEVAWAGRGRAELCRQLHVGIARGVGDQQPAGADLPAFDRQTAARIGRTRRNGVCKIAPALDRAGGQGLGFLEVPADEGVRRDGVRGGVAVAVRPGGGGGIRRMIFTGQAGQGHVIDAAGALGSVDAAAVQRGIAVDAEADEQIRALRLLRQVDRLMLELRGAVCQMIALHPDPGFTEVYGIFYRPVCRAGAGGQDVRLQNEVCAVGGVEHHAPVVPDAPFLHAHRNELFILLADELDLAGGGGVQVAPPFRRRRGEGIGMVFHGKVEGGQRLIAGLHDVEADEGDLVGAAAAHRRIGAADRNVVRRSQVDHQVLADRILREFDRGLLRRACVCNGIGARRLPGIARVGRVDDVPVFRTRRRALHAQLQHQMALAAGVDAGQLPVGIWHIPLVVRKIARGVGGERVAGGMGQVARAGRRGNVDLFRRLVVVLPCNDDL